MLRKNEILPSANRKTKTSATHNRIMDQFSSQWFLQLSLSILTQHKTKRKAQQKFHLIIQLMYISSFYWIWKVEGLQKLWQHHATPYLVAAKEWRHMQIIIIIIIFFSIL